MEIERGKHVEEYREEIRGNDRIWMNFYRYITIYLLSGKGFGIWK